MWTEAFYNIYRQLTVLDILATRRRSSLERGPVYDPASVTSRVPEEIWQEIRSVFISQEVELLEKNAKVGMGKSCGAGKRVKMKPREKWACDYSKFPGREACRSCKNYSKYGFQIRKNFEKVKQLRSHLSL